MQLDRFITAQMCLSNAGIDLELAQEISTRYPSRACFHAQQSSEMGLKATLIALADDHPRAHIGDLLLQEIQALGERVPYEVIVAANHLDLFYAASRYPDALGGADPRKVLQYRDAEAAFLDAKQVYEFARNLIERLEAEACPQT